MAGSRYNRAIPHDSDEMVAFVHGEPTGLRPAHAHRWLQRRADHWLRLCFVPSEFRFFLPRFDLKCSLSPAKFHQLKCRSRGIIEKNISQ